jgi:hypothetical protein
MVGLFNEARLKKYILLIVYQKNNLAGLIILEEELWNYFSYSI